MYCLVMHSIIALGSFFNWTAEALKEVGLKVVYMPTGALSKR